LKEITIIGNGSWGTALAKILTDNHVNIHWWVKSAEAAESLKTRGHNLHYLSSVTFPKERINIYSDINEAIKNGEAILFCVPSAYSLEVLNLIKFDRINTKVFISAVKGLVPEQNELMNDFLQQNNFIPQENYVAITGPSHAEEVAAERLSYLTFAGINLNLADQVAKVFANDYINTTSTNDVWGAQLAAILKNIYAIGAGISHGLDYGDNFLSVYAANCFHEMTEFLKQHFDSIHPSNQLPNFNKSAYLGDLLVTIYSLHSRNRGFGNMIGKGYTVQNAILEMNMVAEGYHAAKGIVEIADTFKIDCPIAHCIYKILWEGANAKQSFKTLEQYFK